MSLRSVAPGMMVTITQEVLTLGTSLFNYSLVSCTPKQVKQKTELLYYQKVRFLY